MTFMSDVLSHMSHYFSTYIHKPRLSLIFVTFFFFLFA